MQLTQIQSRKRSQSAYLKRAINLSRRKALIAWLQENTNMIKAHHIVGIDSSISEIKCLVNLIIVCKDKNCKAVGKP